MEPISRKKFILQSGVLGSSFFLLNGCAHWFENKVQFLPNGTNLEKPISGEDVFEYILRVKGQMDLVFYRQIIGSANAFKEGDLTQGLAAGNEASRLYAQQLLGNTSLQNFNQHPIFEDGIQNLILSTCVSNKELETWTFDRLKKFVLSSSEDEVKAIMPSLSSDVIACVVKIMNNDELVLVGQKIFNPLSNSKIGSKGYMGARVQPNSPTDNVEDVVWQVFDAWSYAVGDLVLGTNPVSSDPRSVAKLELALFDVLSTFGIEDLMPNCVLSHIDIQAQVEEMQKGTTGVWFQSLAGTVDGNKTFDVSIDKMFEHVAKRTGRFGLYAETGQGADFTNGHGGGVDMLIHESRKYGFIRALKYKMSENKSTSDEPWVFVNDVAGFIGPEVFRTREQLVRCCLEDTAMGKLHGLTIGLDICSTLHMDIDLDDLDWCIDQIMPANPAYLMALPTKNDPMLSYLTTAFNSHIKIREKFKYKVNDAMWDFFKKIEILDAQGKPTAHFGDPIWVYYQFCLAKLDKRSKEEIYKEGLVCIKNIRARGVTIAEGYGRNIWDLNPELDQEVRLLYTDAKKSLWSEMTQTFIATIPSAYQLHTQSKDRKDYVYHPESGEKLSRESQAYLKKLQSKWSENIPDLIVIISDGLNARSLMDAGHLLPYLKGLQSALNSSSWKLGEDNILISNGRVRAGYQCGEILFDQSSSMAKKKGIIHIIGERPGSSHRSYSVYITLANENTWHQKGMIDHNITRVISGISDTSLRPEQAVVETLEILNELNKHSI